MTYLLLNAVFLAAVVVLAVVAMRFAPSRRALAIEWAAAALVLVVLTAAFDNLMIAAGLFTYRAEAISGISVGLAPIEDFAYAIAAAVALPSLARLAAGPRRRPGRAPGDRPPLEGGGRGGQTGHDAR